MIESMTSSTAAAGAAAASTQTSPSSHQAPIREFAWLLFTANPGRRRRSRASPFGPATHGCVTLALRYSFVSRCTSSFGLATHGCVAYALCQGPFRLRLPLPRRDGRGTLAEDQQQRAGDVDRAV